MGAPFAPRAELLETERLLLEPLAVGHADEMAAVLGDAELFRYTGGQPPSAEELRKRYGRQVRGRSAAGDAQWLNWIVRERSSGAAVGYVQATVDVVSRVADVAWVVGTPFQGRGYAREAARAMTSWLRAAGATALTARIHPDNAPSEAVARALGLIRTDVVVDGELRWEDAGR